MWQMALSIAGIYVTFLTWAVLQERISTTPYGPDERIFKSSLFINTVQSLLASAIGYIYLSIRRKQELRQASEKSKGKSNLRYQNPVFPDPTAAKQYVTIALSQSLASPLAYASLNHIDYLTYLLAKSCKLVPVMALHVTLYRRIFPLYKYLVVIAITTGVSMFSIFHDTGAKSSSQGTSKVRAMTSPLTPSSDPSSWISNGQAVGMCLLVASLLLDGFYNTAQDHMFATDKRITGPHMMCGLNFASGLISLTILAAPITSQFAEAVNFIMIHPAVLKDIILFAVCGGLGQLFVFYTLEKYGSVVLVTVTVTRKMVSMVLSVMWFGHKLSKGQWTGVALVFSGIIAESFAKYALKPVAKESDLKKNK